MANEMYRRNADINLNNYGNWENLLKGFMNTGANAAGQSSGNAMSRGGTVLGAYTGIGQAQADGTLGAAQARNTGNLGAMSYLTNFIGQAGRTLGGMNFGGGGNDLFSPGTAANGGWSTTTAFA